MSDQPDDGRPSVPAGFRAPGHIQWKSVPDGVVLLNVDTGEHYRLNETGMVVFSGIVQGVDVDAIVADLRTQYDVDDDTARRDVGEVIEYLVTEGCVVSHTNREGENAPGE